MGGAEMGQTPRSTPPGVYQLKVTLKGSRPPIWRRIQVLSDTTLAQLHRLLQCVMGWEDAHLYQFVVSGIRYGDPRLLGELDAEDARTVPLATLGLCEKLKFLYEYDFGDSWEHELFVEKRYCRGTRGSATPSASRVNGPVRPRIAGASGATPVFW